MTHRLCLSSCVRSTGVRVAALALTSAVACASIMDIDTERKGVIPGANQSDQEAGVCTGTVYVRVFNDASGAIKEVSWPNTAGMIDLIRDINDQGGIRGCPIDWDFADTGYDAQRAMEIYLEWKASEHWTKISTLIGMGSVVVPVFGGEAGKDQRVVMSSSFNAPYASPVKHYHEVEVPTVNDHFVTVKTPELLGSEGYPYVFLQGTDYSTGARIGVSFAAKRGARRIAMFYCEDSAYCYDPAKAAKVMVDSLPNLELGRDLIINMTGAEQPRIDQLVYDYLKEELLHKRDQPAYRMVDWAWFGNTRNTGVMTGKAIEAAKRKLLAEYDADPDIKPFAQELQDFRVITNNWAGDEGLIPACPECYGSWFTYQPMSMYGDISASGMPRLMQVFTKWREVQDLRVPELTAARMEEFRVVEYIYGYVTILVWKMAVESVIDAKGSIVGEELSGQELRVALESFSDVDVQGLTAGRLTVSAEDHRPQNAEYIYELTSSGVWSPTGGGAIRTTLLPEWLGW
ncbi:ABC transporter substrate-binding protein [Myxococcota bacterium]